MGLFSRFCVWACSPDEAKRNPGRCRFLFPDCAEQSSGARSRDRWLHPGYEAGTVVAPSPSARCIITVSSQRPNLRPTFGVGSDYLEPGLDVNADRAGIGGIADHRDHLR